MRIRLGALALLLASGGPVSAQLLPTGPAATIMIRPAEEPHDPQNPHLSQDGVARAQRLVEFMTHDPAMIRLGTPAAIFATATTNDGNGQRTQETVAPLASVLHLQVQTPYHGKDYAKLARRVMSDPTLAGKTVVICWNHEWLPQLAAALGVTPIPSKWKNKVYNQVYEITFRNRRALLSTTTYGD